MKESVAIYMQGAPEAYLGFISERNSNIAKDIAGFLGLQYKGEVTEADAGNNYVVPASSLDSVTAERLKIRQKEDFYGGFVDHIQQVGKSILHPAIGKNTPGFYSHEFAEEISGLVLPGVTAFSSSQAYDAYRQLSRQKIDVRLKLPSESDGNGQSVINTEADIFNTLSSIKDKCLKSHGLVLEQNLENIQTISVGRAQIGKDIYSFLALQHEGTNKQDHQINGSFLGASLRVVRGEIGMLTEIEDLKGIEYDAIVKTLRFDNLYEKFMKPVSSRMSYDYLTGIDREGYRRGGITDITARLGGNCPAIMVGIEKLRRDPGAVYAGSVVGLEYNPGRERPPQNGEKVYLNHPKLRITANLVDGSASV